MKIKYSLPKGQRIMKGSIKYENIRYNVFLNAYCPGYWWLEKSKKWVTVDEANASDEDYCTNSCKIRSVKAFKRRLRQWSKYLPKGTEIILDSRFRDIKVTAIL